MSDEAALSADVLLPEIDQLRKSGLASFEPGTVPHLSRLTVEAGYASAGDVTVHAIREVLRLALGLLDRDQLDSSAAHLLGLADEVDLSAPIDDRMAAAAERSGLTVHGYSGRPPKGRKTEDMKAVADNVISVHRKALRRREREERRLAGMPPTRVPVSNEPPDAVQEHIGAVPARDWIDRRHEVAAGLWDKLLAARDNQLNSLGSLSPKLCIFASGSYGRDEAMEFSDLDLFLVDDVPSNENRRNGRVNKFELGAALTLIDRARADLEIQQFSQGGYYQELQSFREMRVARDARPDRHSQLTTARALLLINSKCFANEPLYDELRSLSMDDYWRDQAGDRRPLRPSFLINDLRRLWLTLLVDFEHFYPKQLLDDGRRISGTRRRIAGLKLAVPQKLGCYTPILALLERCGSTGVLRADALEVLTMTTRERLDYLAASADPTISASAAALLEMYGHYLAYSWCDKEEMNDRVSAPDAARVREYFNNATTLILHMLWTYHARIPDVARYALV